MDVPDTSQQKTGEIYEGEESKIIEAPQLTKTKPKESINQETEVNIDYVSQFTNGEFTSLSVDEQHPLYSHLTSIWTGGEIIQDYYYDIEVYIHKDSESPFLYILFKKEEFFQDSRETYIEHSLSFLKSDDPDILAFGELSPETEKKIWEISYSHAELMQDIDVVGVTCRTKRCSVVINKNNEDSFSLYIKYLKDVAKYVNISSNYSDPSSVNLDLFIE